MQVVIVDEDTEWSNLLKNTLWVAFYAKAKALARENQQLNEGLEIHQFSRADEIADFFEHRSGFVQLLFMATAFKDKEKEFFQQVQEHYRRRFGALLLITDHTPAEQDPKAAASAIAGYIVKPFSPEDLMPHLVRNWQL